MSQPETVKLGNRWILYDPEKMPEPDVGLFSCKTAERNGWLKGRAEGRGETCFYRVNNITWALRHYLRGGLVAKLLKDQYLGIRLSKTRAWKEWLLLHEMSNKGLPVPQPVAASVIKAGIFYRADLVTEFLDGTTTLADLLETKQLSPEVWKAIGECVRKFHDRQVFHSDLNARNILLDKDNKIYLIDFDQCGFKKGKAWKLSNLGRLKRSLIKFLVRNNAFNFNDDDWDDFMRGYQSADTVSA